MAIHPAERRLVLWDIDHTLIETRGMGTQLYREAFETVTGRSIEHVVEPTGRTELAIFSETLERHGITSSTDLEKQYSAELVRQYETHGQQLRSHGRRLPGAAAALAAAAELPALVSTVLTGNLRGVAVVKLRSFGLDGHVDFEAGAYGDDDPERARLVPIAQERAGTRYGTTFTRSNTIIVGDTANDVRAAHAGGGTIVAVATGRDTEEQLRSAGAEVVLPDLTDTDRLMAVLTGRLGRRS
ncbi:HAD family hydrolase [Phytohabitans rumicis]|uniref:Haloacid dehalogenase n=1 Tax=Phytohabitans rumicis TaxID=1076125 RepID=A0A6V8L7F5_9ACTN|nr:haloacid dehalogenase-like hydrolase [Phytohabitans rumicis]GFJ92204.1 haloacid dehalogenase [Phytohabitans rumicis]